MQPLLQMWVSFYGPKQRIRLPQQGVKMEGGCVSKVCLQGYEGYQGGSGLLGVEEAALQRWASLLPGKPFFF